MMGRRPRLAAAQRLEVEPTIVDIERFLAKCRQDGECWLWIGRVDDNGYGRFDYAGTNVGSHRFSQALFNGAIPGKKQVHHHGCRNHSCVNPAHIGLATPKRNSHEANRVKTREPKMQFKPNAHNADNQRLSGT